MTKINALLARFAKNESGVTSIEYGLIAAATGLTLVATLPTIETGLTDLFTQLGGGFN